MSKTFISKNNNSEKLLTKQNGKKNSSIFLRFSILFKIEKKKRNVTNFGHVFVTRFHITL